MKFAHMYIYLGMATHITYRKCMIIKWIMLEHIFSVYMYSNKHIFVLLVHKMDECELTYIAFRRMSA